LPFNIASTALFTHIVANMCDLIPSEIVVSIGNAHIYQPHIEGMTEQITRTPYPPPKINIPEYQGGSIDDYLAELSYKNITLNNYNYHPSIKMPLIC